MVELCYDYNATLAVLTSEEQNQFVVHDLALVVVALL